MASMFVTQLYLLSIRDHLNSTTAKLKGITLILDNSIHLSLIFNQWFFILLQLNIRLRQLIFPWYSLNTYNSVQKLWYHILEPIQQPTFLAFLGNSTHMRIRSLTAFTKVINKRSRRTINNIINCCQKRSNILINNQTIKPPFNWST